MRKLMVLAAVVAVCSSSACLVLDSGGEDGPKGGVRRPGRDAGADAGVPVNDAGYVVPAECVLHSDCPPEFVCVNGACVEMGAPMPPPDTGCVPVNEVCNGLDDDCDGLADEGCPPVPPPPPPPPPCVPTPEVCDGTDNDCDGQTDEAPPGPSGDGKCSVPVPQANVVIPGLIACVVGTDSRVRTECLPACASTEACGNTLDDNCDGRTNEHCPERCESDAQCAAGQVCVGNEPFNGTCATPTAESCNGLDDDYDGTVDEGDLCGEGACVNGTCASDVLEQCNGTDDDGDGQVDEGTCPSGQFCLRLPPACAYGGDCVTPYSCQPDADRDTVADQWDNCPAVANVNQRDGDLDGVGDACDNCPVHRNSDQSDDDRDGLGDACECPSAACDPLPPGTVQVTIEVPDTILVADPWFCNDFDGGWDCVPVSLGGPSGRRILIVSPFTAAEHRFNLCFRDCGDSVRGQWGANQARGLQELVHPNVSTGGVVRPTALEDNGQRGANWRVDLRQ